MPAGPASSELPFRLDFLPGELFAPEEAARGGRTDVLEMA